jgi:hypothetical protein
LPGGSRGLGDVYKRQLQVKGSADVILINQSQFQRSVHLSA